MSGLLGLDAIQQRIMAYAQYKASLGELKEEAGLILREVFLRGEVKRGEIPRITGRPERSARRILKELIAQNLVTSKTKKGPIRLCFPIEAAEFYFPGLFATIY